MIARDGLSTWWENYEKQFDCLEKVPPCDPSNLHKEMLIFMHLPGSSLSVYGTVASSLTRSKLLSIRAERDLIFFTEAISRVSHFINSLS